MLKNIERTKDGMDSMIDQAHDAVIGATDRAQRGAESAMEDMAEKTYEAGDFIRDGADMAQLGAHRGVRVAARAISRGYTRAASDLSRAATATTDFVAENPAKTMVGLAATGFVLGMLVGRFSRRNDGAIS